MHLELFKNDNGRTYYWRKYGRSLGVYIWYLDLANAKGHKIIMVKFNKENFKDGKNFDFKEHFQYKQRIIYPSIDP